MGGPEMAPRPPLTLVMARRSRATPRKEQAMRFRVMLAAALALFAVLSFGADAGPIAGSASLSGTVQAPKAFQAAQVHLLNVDKNVLFMVWTSGGRYQAVNLFPGRYEVTVRKPGFSAETKSLTLAADAREALNFSLREEGAQPVQQGVFGFTSRIAEATLVSYDELYPAG